MKTSIVRFNEEIKDAKKRTEEAMKDVKKTERDMSDFDKNKDNKLAELQVS